MGEKIYYVYGLVDPRTGGYFYIGKGKNKRASQHLKVFDPVNYRKQKVIDSIREIGLEPEIHFIAEGMDDLSALELEVELISEYGRISYDKEGVLTNMTKGGDGGDTSAFFTEESLKKISRPGIKNAMAKLSAPQVVEIYTSSDKLEDIVERYGVSATQIQSIKRKLSYVNETSHITTMPGYNTQRSKSRQIVPVDIVRRIFLESGTGEYFKEKYNVSWVQVRGIKNRKCYKKDTTGLGTPGSLGRYKFVPEQIFAIRESTASHVELAKIYGCDQETIYNIRSNRTWKYVNCYDPLDYLDNTVPAK